MALSSGNRLGHYLISTPLGAGGMGEVYRARDSRLDREVAIKVLPEDLAADPERLARFDREAKVLASLNHPNIAHLYGLETSPVIPSEAESRVEGPARLASLSQGKPGRESGVSTSSHHPDPSPQGAGVPLAQDASRAVTFLVMELVEGEDLEQRIDKGPIPIKEATGIGRQIAEGLEAAHTKGVVHRDLKPGNIRISADGTVKILDFGLAKAWEPPPDDRDLDESPTITADMTRAGTLLGTAPYMSPEQARGQVVDRRADIWAFGCVLYEMLTGRRAFVGGTATEILARILERDPEWEALPADVPTPLRRLVERCLEKDPKRRLRDAGDLALALEDVDLEPPPAAVFDNTPHVNPAKMMAPWLVAAVAAAAAIIAWIGRPPPAQPEAAPTLRFSQSSPAPLDISQVGHSGSAVAISPDGHVVVWVGVTEAGTQLFSRLLDEDETHPIAHTEEALSPFFSPDGEWIGFWANGRLQKVSVRGGVPQTICETSHVHGASWGDGIIVMGAVGDGTLWRVNPGGGPVERVEEADGRIIQGEYPKLLPDSRAVLVSQQGRNTVDLLSLDTGEVTTIVSEGSNARYLRSGHLVWTHQDNLLAAPFDLSTRMITGEAHTVIEGVLTEAYVGMLSHYAVSDEGTLVYLPGTIDQAGARPTWVTLDGATEALPIPADTYLSPRISPDGLRLLLSRQSKTRTIWLAEPGRGVMRPITDDGGNDYWAIWTPDGTKMIFNSGRPETAANLWVQSIDHSSSPTRLTTAPMHQPPADITRDGRIVVFGSAIAATDDVDIHLLHLDGEPTTAPLLETDADEVQPKLSPDDRWLAYASDLTGRFEVYVQRFPDLGSTVRVSPNGGQEPLWSPSGDRLYYRSLNGRQTFAVEVVSGDPLQFGQENLLFESRLISPGIRWGRKWDLHPDGDRFLMLQAESSQSAEEIRVVVNWFTELERLVPSTPQ